MCDGCEVNQKYYKFAIEPTKEDLLLESLCIPTQTQIRRQMGSKLADVFFENLSSEGRLMLGLQPPLTGPDEIWINPVSRLRNKVRCEPVPEPQVVHQKAFTHKAILELGQKYIDYLTMKLEKDIGDSLKEQRDELEEDYKKRLSEGLEKAKIEAEDRCREIVGTLMEHFDRCFTNMVEESKLRMRKECQLKVQEEKSDLAAYMFAQLQEEVEKRNSELCSEFRETLKSELDAEATRYINQIDAERKVAQQVIEDIVRRYEKSLVDLRAEMEIASLVDVCRAISEEKSKHEQAPQTGEADVKKKLELLAQWVVDLKKKNEELQAMASGHVKRFEVYEKKMKELVEEFQKFINFALKAEPGHAQFLLSTEKMVMKMLQEGALLTPEDHENMKNCLEKKATVVSPTGSLSIEEKTCVPVGQNEEKPQQSATCKEEKDSKYTFNYYKFKYHLLKKFVKGLNFSEGEQTKVASPYVARKKPDARQQVEDDVLSEHTRAAVKEYKEGLILDGEKAKEHLKSVGSFLEDRKKAIFDLCRDDPNMVKLILGCPEPKTDPCRKC